MQLENILLSDITTHMKYAKFIPELNRRETFKELVDRNKDMHKKKYPMLNGDVDHAYQYVYDKKVLPSMRSMQFAGRPIEINPTRIYNCHSKDTKFLTDKGLRSFKDFEHGDEITVLTHLGRWKNAVVKSYGVQKLNKLTFKKGRREKIVYATANHRWLLKDGSETTNIKVEDGLATVSWFNNFVYEDSTPEERLMWAYGYIYGDGTRVKNSKGEYKYSQVRLCGDDNKFSVRFEELGFKSLSPKSFKGDKIFYTGAYQKELPKPEIETPEAIRAFIRGYLDADGAKDRAKDTESLFCSLQSSKGEHLEKVRDLLAIAGFWITSEKDLTGQETNYGIRSKTKIFRGYTAYGKSPNSNWYLREVEENVKEEKVWCLEVEDDHSFVLEGGLVTGNCAYLPIDDWKAFPEVMFLLLGGTGVGYSVQRHHVRKLPNIMPPDPTRKRRFVVGDSIEGWADAIKMAMKQYFFGGPTMRFDFSDIRPKGARLVTSGGKAPGPQPLIDCITKITGILNNKSYGDKLTTLEVHDIICHIADAVLAGGIRRAALISLFSADDPEMVSCKSGSWWELNPQRGRANNSAVLVRHRVTKKFFKELWQRIEASGSGEPGIYFTNDKNWGSNPCCEIALRPFQFCNLVEINASDIKTQKELNARATAAAFIATLQAGYTDFHYLRDVWKETTEQDALLGVSMTGIASRSVLKLDLNEAVKIIRNTNKDVAKRIGINPAARTTCVKPAGTTSLVLGTSSGIHAWHNDFYIRRLRVGKNEAIYTYLSINHPELVTDEYFRPHDTAVIEVPQKAPDGAITRHESAMDLLERVKKVSEEWVAPGHIDGENTHNVSATISIKPDEWEEIGEWMWKNRDSYNGLSVLPHDGGTYTQAPFEDCTKEKYNELKEHLHAVDISKVVEMSDETDLSGEVACGGGACEVI